EPRHRRDPPGRPRLPRHGPPTHRRPLPLRGPRRPRLRGQPGPGQGPEGTAQGRTGRPRASRV
ncbi:MAG: hypothetical protein AVDCRST_MAG02-1328, partial [uncultured Rubrobacteraceae bacterium]